MRWKESIVPGNPEAGRVGWALATVEADDELYEALWASRVPQKVSAFLAVEKVADGDPLHVLRARA